MKFERLWKYSENKEKDMKLIMQPTALTCGQACIAMIAGKSVEESNKKI